MLQAVADDTELLMTSKLLVLDGCEQQLPRLKAFCEAHGLTGLRAQADNLAAVLRSNVDLGAVLVAEGDDGLALARAVHRQRPELPIFLRRAQGTSLDDLPADARALFCAGYSAERLDALAEAVERWIFTRVYPAPLVRGIVEMTTTALASQFRAMRIDAEPPYVVRDRLIHGELYTLIPLESQWCRGYMTLQAREGELMALVRAGRTAADPTQAGLRTVNHVFGEVTNLIWGAFKNRFVAYEDITSHLAQVPIVVNHEQRYISFGSDDPQLCFRYTLVDERGEQAPLQVYQRFIFNLSWSPDDFRENRESLDALVEAGELELF
jgi:hypothetical protein